MGLILDIVIIALIALSTFLAYKKGLVALAIKLCAVIIALVATLILYKPLANLIINTTNIDETIQNAIMEKSFEVLSNKDNTIFTIDELEQAKNNAITQTSRDLSIQIVNVCVIVVLYFGIKFALKFVTVIADKVAKLPILSQFNKIGGFAFGLLRGIVIVYACLLLVGFVGKVDSKNVVFESVQSSTIGKLMYEHNVFEALVK